MIYLLEGMNEEWGKELGSSVGCCPVKRDWAIRKFQILIQPIS
jgi:hypothetical protein